MCTGNQQSLMNRMHRKPSDHTHFDLLSHKTYARESVFITLDWSHLHSLTFVKMTLLPKVMSPNTRVDYLKYESISCSRNKIQIQINIPAYLMSSENFMRTSLYLVRLKIFEWIKLLQRHLHQIQGNSASRNFKTALRVNSWLITHATIQRWISNIQQPTDSTSE